MSVVREMTVTDTYTSRNHSPQAPWPAVGGQERLWGTGILFTAGFLR